MRTTLDIADDVLFAAKEIAQREKKPVGEIISDLARRAFSAGSAGPLASVRQQQADATLTAIGICALASRGGIVTNDMVNRIREQEGI
jgi:hypothetical protein